MRAGVVRVDGSGAVPLAQQSWEAQRPGGKAFGGRTLKEFATSPRQQMLFVATIAQSAKQIEYLPLAAAHFASGIEVQNSHGRGRYRLGDMMRTLANFRKL